MKAIEVNTDIWNASDVRSEFTDSVRLGRASEHEYIIPLKMMQEIYLKGGDEVYSITDLKSRYVIRHRKLCPGVFAVYLVPATNPR